MKHAAAYYHRGARQCRHGIKIGTQHGRYFIEQHVTCDPPADTRGCGTSLPAPSTLSSIIARVASAESNKRRFPCLGGENSIFRAMPFCGGFLTSFIMQNIIIFGPIGKGRASFRWRRRRAPKCMLSPANPTHMCHSRWKIVHRPSPCPNQLIGRKQRTPLATDAPMAA